jgi:transcriptional regulator with XRE-family HTH domain
MRLRAARERLGLSREQAASQMCVTVAAISAMETDDDEIGSCRTLADIRRFSDVLRITPRELFDIPATVSALRPAALAQLIRDHCQSRGISIDQFKKAVGWPLGTSVEGLGDLKHDPSLVVVADICRELKIDWRRVFATCDHAA